MLQVNWLIAGVIVVEFFFSYKGFGSLILEASLGHDFYLLEACTMVDRRHRGGDADGGRCRLRRTSTRGCGGERQPGGELRAARAGGAWRRAVGRLLESKAGHGPDSVIVAFWVFVAIAAPWIAPFSPTRSYMPMQHPMAHAPGGGMFLLGTDHLGRDLLSRLIWGTRTVLTYAPLATVAPMRSGVAAGLAAGYRRGWMDELLSRGSDLVLAFPALVLYIAIIGRFGASGLNIVLAVVLATSPGVMRIVRGVVLEERGRAYVDAARMRGESGLFITVVEILPNVRGPLIVDLCIRLGYVTITIGTLGFPGAWAAATHRRTGAA